MVHTTINDIILHALGSSDLEDVLLGGMSHGIMPMDEEAEFPYIVWSVENSVPMRDKCGMYGVTHTVGIEVVARDYDGIEEAVSAAVNSIEAQMATYNESADDDAPVLIDYDWSIGAETYDDAHDGPYRQITMTIETK